MTIIILIHKMFAQSLFHPLVNKSSLEEKHPGIPDNHGWIKPHKRDLFSSWAILPNFEFVHHIYLVGKYIYIALLHAMLGGQYRQIKQEKIPSF